MPRGLGTGKLNVKNTVRSEESLFKYIIKRILIALPVLIGITILDYAIMSLAGSPLEMMLGPKTAEAALKAKEIQLGLDKPFYVQYFVWLKNVLQGNLGYSIKNYQPVIRIIGNHLGPTLTFIDGYINAGGLGNCYTRRNIVRFTDTRERLFACDHIIFGTSIPSFFWR